MVAPELARRKYTCQYCGLSFDEGRTLGGHVRQQHQKKVPVKTPMNLEGDMAARVLQMWREGTDPYSIVITLRVHPVFVRGVLKEYDELLNEWKQSSEAATPSPGPNDPATPSSPAEKDEKVV